MTKSVLVACLVSQEESWLPLFLDCLTKLDYPRDAIRYAFVEGKKISLLHQWAKDNTWIKECNPPISDRFERLAYLRNLIVEEAHPILKEDYIFWIDSDVVGFPSHLLVDLMKHNVPVVAPSVYIEGTDKFYDTFAFRFTNGKNFPARNLPPSGLLEVSSIGTCYLVASRLYSQNKVRYRGGDSEQVTFCRQVRNIGERIYVDFAIRVQHVNFPKYGRSWH